MSDSGDSAKTEKKREYNRNAQRLFRQRRKEHLKSLERADKERSSTHAEEVESLRQEINQLRTENRALRLYNTKTPPLDASVFPSAALTSSPLQYPTSPFSSLDLYNSTHDPVADKTVKSSSQTHDEPERFCALFPQDIATVRRDLHMRLSPVLDLNILTNPRLHLSALAALGPSLPPSLRPTVLQLQRPHHAYIDLIPSPTLRDSLIRAGVEIANTFLTEVCTFVYETEDLGQLTIWGRDYLNVMSWEFSEEVLKAWPNLLTTEWRERANFWRAQRNEQPIKFG
ncbi:hypothetical protein UA08_04550 [Talaromyces atroroseus]|uniref:BZIP domain-containing protein n=1 Tax=Talaromyces atroroseus TaxID=1441469 RepID=A0A225AY59_TALAT|nr:hypothetical protein UA08_04550 [Talaromyces atroroseus]OKL59906.1 hypothetical protein UA08_04550 [Talaromyces atroroseus]